MSNVIKGIIVDDMMHAQEALLKDLAEVCPEVEIIGRASSVVEAAKLLKIQRPDVLFLDIELDDGTGFDLLEILPNIDFKIIFTTASDQHAIKAFRFSAIDYLLKPIDLEALRDAVSKIELSDTKEKVEVLLDHWVAGDHVQKIALQNSDKIEIISTDQIVRCEAENNYTTFYFLDESRFLVSRSLKSYERLLEPLGFIRVHQSHLVNADRIKSYIKSEGGYLQMENGDRVPVAVRKKAQVIERLTGKQ